MGYPTSQQKVDYLFKKIGFSASKTGVAEDQTGFAGNKKAPPNEAIPSPLVVPASSLWADTSYIPATPPTSSDGYVGVYKTTSSFRMTVDSTVSNNRTFIARDTWGNPASAIKGDWIDTQFGADYIIKVYKGDPSTSAATKILSAAGTSGKDDVWFFDYSSGVLNFNGEDLNGQLAGITTSNIYIVGYRYLGTKGVQPPAGIGTFNNLYVSGISTFVGLVDINGGGQANTFKVEDLTDNRIVIAGTGGELEDSGNLTFDGTNFDITGSGEVSANWKVTGISTFTGAIDANGDLDVDGRSELDNVNIAETLNVVGVSTFTGAIDANGSLDVDGRAELDNVNIAETLNVVGVSTFTGNIDANGDLDVDGRSELDNVNIAETLNVVGVSTFNEDVKFIGATSGRDLTWDHSINRLHIADNADLAFGDGNDLIINHTGSHSFIQDAGSGNLNILSDSLYLQNTPGTKVYLKALVNNQVDLYHNNAIRVTTTEYGALISGGQAGIGTLGGPAILHIDPATVGDDTGLVVIKGNLQVDGTQTTVNSATMTVTDKNIEIAKGAANNAAADGAGITVDSGSGVKTWNWVHSTGAWTSSEHIRVPNDKVYGFSGDTNTYIDRPAGDTIRFTTGNSERLLVTNDGINVTGISTFSSNIDANGDLDVDGRAELDNVNIAETLNVVGVSTFTGAIDANGDLDVDGRAELDNVNIAETLNVVGVSTFTGNIDANGDLDVDGRSELDNVNIAETLNVVGVSTFAADIDANADMELAGNLAVTGVSTFTGNIDANGDLDVDGRSELDNVNIAETLNVVGVSTFNNDVNLIGGGAGITSAYWDQSAASFKFLDSVKAQFGDNGDLSIEHNGSNSIISNTNANLWLQAKTGQHGIKIQPDGVIQLHHSGTEVFETQSWGFWSHGSIKPTGTRDLGGTSNRWDKIYGKDANLSGDLDVDGTSDLDQVNIAQGLNVTAGIATFAGDIDANADMELAGNLAVTGVSTFTGISTFSSTVVSQKSVQIEENLNVTGITTFNGAITLPPGTGGNFGNINIAVTGNNEIDTDSGNLIIDSAGGTINVDDGLTVAGVSTFTGTAKFDDTVGINVAPSTGSHLYIKTTGGSDGSPTTKRGLLVQESAWSDGNLIEAQGSIGNTIFKVGGTPNDVEIPNDTSKLKLGASGDLSIYHDGASWIKNTSGNLTLNSDVIHLKDAGNNKSYLRTYTNDRVEIYFNNAERLRTTGTGVKITNDLNVAGVSTFTGAIDANGDLDVDGRSELDNVNIAETLNVAGITTFNVDTGFIGGGAGITSAYWDQSAASFKFLDNVKAQFGDSQDLSIWHDGTNSIINNTTGTLYVQSGSNIHLQTNSKESVYAEANGQVKIYFNGNERLKTTGTGVEISDDLNVAGVSTFVGETNIGTGGTVFTALVGAAASVGIGSALPDYMLDVAGAINSETDVKVQGVSISDTALNDAVAMAIALG